MTACYESGDMSAHDYPVLREVSTFSWVGVRHHGRGIGTEMWAAALHLAFAGLGATERRLGLEPCLPLFGLRGDGAS